MCRSRILPYRLDMPARKRPTPQEAVIARQILLPALTRDAEVSGLLTELAPLSRDVFVDWRGASRADPVALEGIRERFLPDCAFRGRERRKLQFAVLAAAALRGGTEPDLLEEVAWWQTGDFWQYALFAVVACIRAASRAGRAHAQARDPEQDRPGHGAYAEA